MDLLLLKDFFNIILSCGVLILIICLYLRKRLPPKFIQKVYLVGSLLYLLAAPYYFFLRNDPLQSVITLGFSLVFYDFSKKK